MRSRTHEIVEARLGYRFRDRARLDHALTHRSFAYEQGGDALDSYERLEFLGDALLGFLVSDRLFRVDPGASEGLLTRRKQVVVRTDCLAAIAAELGLGEVLRLGRGEIATGGRSKASLLADAFEAVLGAVYVDGGLRAARSFVSRHLRERLVHAASAEHVAEDYKTRLQERIQARRRATPSYRVVSSSGPDHDRRFVAEVVVENRVLGVGEGASRKRAEQMAAKAALAALRGGGEGGSGG